MDIGSNSIILKREKKKLWIAIAHCCVIINASEFETLRGYSVSGQSLRINNFNYHELMILNFIFFLSSFLILI